jgi:hypothetical protein
MDIVVWLRSLGLGKEAGSVVLRATISVPDLRPKSVPVQLILAIDVAKALAEHRLAAPQTAQRKDF